MTAPVSPELSALASNCGIELAYEDYQGNRAEASVDSLMATLRALGVELARPEEAGDRLAALRESRQHAAVPPCTVVWGEAPLSLPAPAGPWRATLRLEGGEEHRADGDGGDVWFAGPLPHGYHRLALEHGGEEAAGHVFVAPERAWGCPNEAGRRWGVFAPLYALRREGGSGAGDLGDLERLGRLVRDRGGQVLATLPLLAGFLDEPYEHSPYGPVSRRFWNELYVDLERLGAGTSPALAERARALAALPLVDYREQYALIRARLEPVARRAWTEERSALEAFAADHPEVADYAAFRAACERFRTVFACWPEAAAAGRLGPGDYDLDAWRFHVFAQRAMDAQLAELGAGVDLYLDLPVGVHRWGYDVWRERDAFALGASAGAPPDGLFTGGQNWGAPPLDPRAARQSGHQAFIEVVSAHMRHARLLRVDHVIGLHRLYWVPEGMGARDGCYVRYPAEELYAVLCIESHRAFCAVAGEDLGTVPPAVRPALQRHGMHRLYVGEFSLPGWDDAVPETPPMESVASINTHDTPTFAGFWAEGEIDTRVELGLLDEQGERHERAYREKQRQVASARWAPGTDGDVRAQVVRGWNAELAASPARVALITLEDAWLEPGPQNQPGTGPERPNWRRRMSLTLDEIETDERVSALMTDVSRVRRD